MSDSYIYESLGCPVLAKNMALINKYNLDKFARFMKSPSQEGKFDVSIMLDEIEKSEEYNVILEQKSFPIETAQLDLLSVKYHLPIEQVRACEPLLKTAAHLYLSHMGRVWIKPILKMIESDLDDMVSLLAKLNSKLEPLLELGKQTDIFFDNYPFNQTLTDVQRNLEAVGALKSKLRLSTIGAASNLGNNAPLGNPGLTELIRVLWLIWNDCFGRTLKQEYDGKNGRKQFLEFIIDCLESIHPALEYDTIDNALKKFQQTL